ncbi:protein mahjong [Copidosoma floridanum]|uniref:protein mahjong n=1 Tax=Copidosoma floridanum TaxID=29053 RepID=UPI0006C94ED9|nr:protein mahjong [Copidosoma floridanum]XP_014210789.1 protein mahjong [Copidosoma floridanum]XP_014210790.1 protein mahjong [Copidosoma floridanum]XP_014210791.1 protein mahjong [Copidosoma floridanum]XP_014210792.1 protein mahjong [Copidosoma floridanum]
MATAESLADMTDVSQILKQWEEDQNSPTYDPIPTLQRLAEIIEQETENYHKMDPDPFDERHPSRTDPDCNFGHILKVLFKKDIFMTKLINDYLRDNYWLRVGITNRDVRELNTSACRLMLDILPGLETSAVFQPDMETLIHRLFSWAEKSSEPLQSYATGLLAAAMEVQDIATGFREQNGKMVPLMLKRLHELQEEAAEERQQANACRPFAHLGQNRSNSGLSDSEKKSFPGKRKVKDKKLLNGLLKNEPQLSDYSSSEGEAENDNTHENPSSPPLKRTRCESEQAAPVEKSNLYLELMSPPATVPMNTPKKSVSNAQNTTSPKEKNNECKGSFNSPLTNQNLKLPKSPWSKTPGNKNNTPSTLLEGNSNSSWAEMESYVIGNIQIYPPTLATRQMLILRYLTPMGEYQEFLGHVFEQNSLELILQYVNVRETKDSRLAFEALKYLASLLCHKKFSIEFLSIGGLQRLLDVPRPSVAATGVSICLYYLAYCEDAMEKVCLLPKHVITDLVAYTLWLLERSHDSGRCHATMFFGFSFSFRVILDEFDAQDGLRKLYNVISTLPLLNIEEESSLNEDEECAARQIVRHVAVALKKYMEAHLYWKAEYLQRIENARTERESYQPSLPPYKACKLSTEEVQAKIEVLQELMNMRSLWPPVEQLHRLGGTHILFQIIGCIRDWSAGGRVTTSTAETVRACLDVIGICSVVPKVMLLLCERVETPDTIVTNAVNLLLAAAECEIIQDPDVQRAALYTLINCVCAPTSRAGGNLARYSVTGSAKKKTNVHSSEELIQKIWECVRSNNGIMILLQLMMVKLPITDADSIRALACRALAGLARSEKVRQIISKLSMFAEGQIQALMKDPILQEKRQEHVMFQKYALELIERVSGRAKPTGAEYEISLASLHRANVVAQTRIQYNEQQLFQLIHQHLLSKGLIETAATLQREANFDSSTTVAKALAYQQSFCYRNPVSTSPRPGFSPAASTNLYNTRCTQRDATTRTNTTPTTSSRFVTHTSAVSCSTPVVNNCSTRLKLNDSANQSPILNNQPVKLQINPKKAIDKQQQQLSTSQTNVNSNTSQSNVQLANNQSQQALCRSLMKQISRDSVVVAPVLGISTTNVNTITLDSIITEYLTNQHALCKNPMVTCPQFNLLEHHKCPDPCKKNSAPLNIAMRLSKRQLGIDSRRLDTRFIYSRFCPVKTFRPSDIDSTFTCCTFSPCQEYLFLGTYAGEVKMYNTRTGVEENTYTCHESYLSNIECNRRGDLLLTSSPWRSPMSALWTLGAFFEVKIQMENEDYAEFSKQQDRIVATSNEVATIYDISTGTKINTLTPRISNQYNKNKATFSMNDELILSDGILWDVNSGKEIHKFDKLNQTLNGVFHPNGTEVVSNTEVWDLRTFHLLKTVPALDQMNIIFSPCNNIIYAFSIDQENEEETTYATSFKTLDAFDYNSISTFDTKRGIYDLACNKFDTQIAIVENSGEFDSIQESCIRLYDVGRCRNDEDEAEEEEDDEEDMDDGSEDDGSNSGSDDNNDGDGGDGGGDDNGEGDDRNDGDDGDDNSDIDDSADESIDFPGFSSDEFGMSDEDVEILFN